ncbi:putative immunity protein [Brevibacillus choshinensis]|uniref:putative immunity protein n=1 Tax=Brevibacillus choshinensis TaxID=54911 RepID=UPI0038B3E03F
MYFEKTYPNDSRPRNAIEPGRAWMRGEIAMCEARAAAFARFRRPSPTTRMQS